MDFSELKAEPSYFSYFSFHAIRKMLTYVSPISAAIVLPFVSACCFYKISLIVSVW